LAEDFYQTLGLQRDASQADVQKAYRDLARKYHPDLNPNDKTAKEKFQKVQAAFDVLNDTSKREMYDRYGSSFESRGQGGPRPQGRGGSGAAPGFEEIDLGDLFGQRYGGDPSSFFGDLFGGQYRRKGSAGTGKRGRKPAPEPTVGTDLQQQIEIPFQISILGGQIELSVPRSSGHIDTIKVKIPAGIADGAKMRLRGQGESLGGEPPGDILLTVRVAPHPWFTRRGNNLEVKLPVTLAEAILGAKVDVPTPRGTISLRVPPHTSSGTKLRIKGHGVKAKDGPVGDLFADVLIVLPEKIDDATIEAVKKQSAEQPQNPRSGLQW
jgi:DnaJ-class molecular chaperone